MMNQVGTSEITITNNGWGGDFEWDDPDGTGPVDLAVTVDTIDSFDATNERLYRRICTMPRTKNAAGDYANEPDDIFHADDGAGLPARIGEKVTREFQESVHNDIYTIVKSDPGVDSTQPVTSMFSQVGGITYVTVKYTNLVGNVETIPNIPLAPVQNAA